MADVEKIHADFRSDVESVDRSSHGHDDCPTHDTKPTHSEGLSEESIQSCASHEYADGGLKACLAVFGASLALFSTFGQMNAFGTFQAWYADHQLQHLHASTISWIGSLQLWVFFFSGGPIGFMFDLYGPRILMATGSLLYILSLVLTSISTQFYQYVLAQGILFGLGVGLLFYPSLASVSTYFCKYRASALGIAAAGSSLGGVMYPIMLQHLFEHVGFGWGVRVSALVSGVGCGIALVTVTALTPGQKRGRCSFRLCSTFKDGRFDFLMVGSSLVALGLFIPLFYIVDFAHDLSISRDTSYLVLALMNLGGVFGRIAPAVLSDTIGRFNILAPSAFLSGVLCLTLWILARTLSSVIAFSILYGFFSGSFISVITPCVAQISDVREIGTRIGVLYSVISFPSLIGGPTAGALLALEGGSYTGMIIFSGATTIAGSCFIIGAKLMIDSRILARV
ncbi:MFS general substrate transporter [Guyanagaster necrorhizus]|uniref:MFS general substrate transporter n=1 Tax=Guyanagaster necrorhizus TaxID=856835 RepID=A0A9P7VNN2_9AGAR|nr:MFS general substrate transporter [Guyanagaster necrorhizus MCA 3950]KAG7444069.1 MFS general substrate transporter [Guyanagaster necrorhizus MCA 3950]